MAFHDRYLAGKKPTNAYPAYAVQDDTGAWRGQKAWPAADKPRHAQPRRRQPAGMEPGGRIPPRSGDRLRRDPGLARHFVQASAFHRQSTPPPKENQCRTRC